MTHQQVIALFQHLQKQHPEAFKRNFLFYSLIKTKGIMDELKEIIPWILAGLIFISSTISVSRHFATLWPNLSDFQYTGTAILIIMLIMRLYSPYVLWQIKHSSNSLYQHLKNTPFKLSIVILLQSLNLLYIESSVLQYALFFFACSFGFVRLYKENMFLATTTLEQQYYLQQIRRATLWAYKNQKRLTLKSKLASVDTQQHLQQQLSYFSELHQSLKNYENKMCSTYKHNDVESYMDDIK